MISTILRKIGFALNPLLPFRILQKHRSAFRHLLSRQLTMRYRASVLGVGWSFIQPLFMLIIYTYVFREVFKVRWGNEAVDSSNSMFAITMFCGIAFFNIFSEAVNACCSLMVSNVNFVKKIVFPLELLPMVQVTASAVTGLVWFLLVIAANVFYIGFSAFSPALLYFPLILGAFLLFTAGIGFFTASFGVFYRDTQFTVAVVLQVLFFITPIFYPVSAVPERFRWVLEINPLSAVVDQARNVLLNGIPPHPLMLAGMLLTGWIICQLGLAWFLMTKKGFADVL